MLWAETPFQRGCRVVFDPDGPEFVKPFDLNNMFDIFKFRITRYNNFIFTASIRHRKAIVERKRIFRFYPGYS